MGLLAGTVFDRPPHCDRCELPETECQCPPETESAGTFLPADRQTVRLAVERRKHGRKMTVVRGLSGSESDLPALLKRLKNVCGAGGTLEEEALEVQGDHLERVRTELRSLGYRIRG